MSYRLGVDVGGTFTDVLLVEEASGATWRAKTASTPSDQAVGVLNGIGKVCAEAGIALSDVAEVLHGTTVATNAILEGKGATVGLVTTRGFRQVLQIARSYVPGGLAGWIIWPKPEPLAALENTVEVDERIASDGRVIRRLDEDDVRAQLATLVGIDALAVSLINSFADRAHEQRIREIAAEVLPGVPVSLSSDVLPELREYERTVTTVANGYVQPQVRRYVETLAGRLADGGVGGELAILRSDGGLSTAAAAVGAPVTMLLSGPAGGVTGAVWTAEQCGYSDLITFDMGGTSTDVALVQGLTPRIGRETKVGDLTVRASSVDVRTVGAGGGSIAHVPGADEGAARRPAERGRRPRPGRLRQGRHRADGDRCERRARLPAPDAGRRRDHPRRLRRAGRRRQGRRGDGAGLAGGGGRGHRRHRQREHARRPAAGVGAAGFRPARLRARRLRGCGAAARQRPREADGRVAGDRAALARGALRAGRCHHLQAQRVGPHRAAQVRRPHRGRPRADPARAGRGGGRAAGRAGRHRDRPGHGLPGGRALPRAGLRDPRRGHRPRRRCAGHARRRVRRRARAAVLVPAHRRPRAGQRPRDGVGAAAGGRGDAPARERGPPTPVDTHPIHISGATVEAAVYDRTTLRAGHVVTGPAIVTEMDSTTLVLPGHAATVHPSGSLLITPQEA